MLKSFSKKWSGWFLDRATISLSNCISRDTSFKSFITQKCLQRYLCNYFWWIINGLSVAKCQHLCISLPLWGKKYSNGCLQSYPKTLSCSCKAESDETTGSLLKAGRYIKWDLMQGALNPTSSDCASWFCSREILFQAHCEVKPLLSL